ncbi:MAG: peptide chain release factor N(5)-glutamine methyltransferase [Alphaproteobacteria bacterium]|nr:peptide chain release factor N(5)-glutamine methyltransferase [Alphaproteobacteria bacterium]
MNRLNSSADELNGAATIAGAQAQAAKLLQAAGIDSAAADSRLLLQHVSGLSHAQILSRGDDAPGKEILARYIQLIERRLKREPVSRITGTRAFWTAQFEVSSATLDPRPETETLVEFVLAWIQQRPVRTLRILDLGTGSGAILCSLLSALPEASGIGTDISTQACDVARRNVQRLQLEARARIMNTSWAEGIPGPFDIIVSNPPYIATAELEKLEPEVRCYDPLSALDGGVDGLEAYRIIVSMSRPLLAPGGLFAVEIGAGQDAQVSGLIRQAGFLDAGSKADLQGICRVVAGIAG